MKNILFALAIVFTLNVAAQEHPEHEGRKGKMKAHKEFLQSLTPEQHATLQTKKLTLALDLSEQQQAKVLSLQTKQATERKAKMEAHKAMKEKGEKPTEEQRYQLMNERLDAQIAYKKSMKKILTNEQYERWEKMQHHKGKQKKQRGGKRMAKK
ncbi:hypothetical protein C8N46_11230 [Kordia periserrulae]|uniref:Spy/CpxP family protein refolding chaperone n=1 Tax=Kordia periserrulae TaxID=701523 RepID=A0A2T6BRN6_9FLAO|nr:hypothetical protein [Kordia periserrulae]PTX58722.1 hypothetical protein C8N46_11230 [Kordia periserrulae]